MNILKPIVLSVAASIPFLSSGVVTDELTYNWGPADTVAHHKVAAHPFPTCSAGT